MQKYRTRGRMISTQDVSEFDSSSSAITVECRCKSEDARLVTFQPDYVPGVTTVKSRDKRFLLPKSPGEAE